MGYQDKEVLEELYVEKGLSTTEVGEQFEVSSETVRRWLIKHGIELDDVGPQTDNPWNDPDTLRDLYHSKGLSGHEIADRLGCDPVTVYNNMDELGVTRKRHNKSRRLRTGTGGYEVIRTTVNKDVKVVRLHRLAAVAWFGYSEVLDNDVHHKNECTFDNRECNLEVMSRGEHTAHHNRKG